MTTGDRVKMLRERKGMTQEELANKLGYKSKTSVAHIEAGRDIPRSMVVKLAEILEATPAYLMGWEDENSASAQYDRDDIINKINQLPEDKIDKLLGYLDGLSDK